MCDAGMDGDMCDHSTESGNWILPNAKVVDPVRSDPRWSSTLAKHNGDEEKAFQELTKGDSPATIQYAREAFTSFRKEYPYKRKSPKPVIKKKEPFKHPKNFSELWQLIVSLVKGKKNATDKSSH